MKNFLCSLALILPTLLASSCGAEGPDAPVVLGITPTGGCAPVAEICGDGLDQDCDGSDVACTGSDADNDGFLAGADCDDNNKNVYPGISVACEAPPCGQGTRSCQSDGTFSSCSCTPTCEANGGGSCYYVSATSGALGNPGTWASPWKTIQNFVSYYESGHAPANHVRPGPGDVVYFMSGVYSHTYDYNGQRRALFLRGIHGTPSAPIVVKAYPGQQAIIEPDQHAEGIYILQSSNIILEGFEVRKAWQSGVRVEESSNVEARNLWIHDTDGIDSDNVAGFHSLDVENLELHHSLLHDNYDHTNDDTGGMKTENSRNMVLFRGGDARIHHNTFYQSPPLNDPKTGGCITYKHAANQMGSVFEVAYNTFRNCWFTAVGSGTSGTRIHHNLIINSDPIVFRNNGGTTRLADNIVEYNTIVGGTGLSYEPTNEFFPIGDMIFRNNIVVDSGTYGQERGMVTVHPYGSDELYDQSVGKMSINSNCYYNESNEPRWSLFADNDNASMDKGGIYNISEWRALGFDTSSQVVNPQLSSTYIPQEPGCQGYGAYPQ